MPYCKKGRMRILQSTKSRCHPRLVSSQYPTMVNQTHFCCIAPSSAGGRAIRTYVKNTLSRSRAKDVAYVKNHFIFRPEPEPALAARSPTYGFFKRTWSEERRAHNKSLSFELLARDERGFYVFLRRPLFQTVVSAFINERGLDGKVDRHSIQTYVGVIVSSKLYSERRC
jgi:hypothetical protein